MPMFFSVEKNIGIGFVSTNVHKDTDVLVNEIASEVGKFSNSIIFSPVPISSAKNVDFWIQVSVRPDYAGSFWNLPINFPGFLIFMPAWHGYVYQVTYVVDVSLLKGSSLSQVDRFIIPFTFDIRHADFNRTWTEIGWLETGIIPLVGGLFFTQFDDNVAGLVPEETKEVVARTISRKIINSIGSK